MIERGGPSSLKLVQLQIRNTVLRAPGPGPLAIQDWLAVARKVSGSGHRVCLHTGSAQAYNVPIKKVSHTAVVYKLKKCTECVFAPSSLKPRTSTCEGRRVPVPVKAGTQTID
eukprot:2909036-Amphidinium_carterae.1